MEKTAAPRSILVYDREGSLGEVMTAALATKHACVFVSARIPASKEHVRFVHARTRIPRIPNGSFSSVYLVYSGDRMLLDLLPSFVKKAKTDGAHIFFVIASRDADSSIIEKIRRTPGHITILLLGDIFGGGDWDNPVTTMLFEAQNGSVSLPQDGLLPVYPVHQDDLLTVIIATSTRAEFTRVKLVCVFPPERTTALSFARLLAKKEPLLRIDFVGERKLVWREGFIPGNYQSVFGRTYNYAAKLPLLSIGTQLPVKTKRIAQKIHIPVVEHTTLFGSMLMLLVLLCTPLLATAIGGGFLLQAKQQFGSGQLQKTRTSAVAAGQFFAAADRTKEVITVPLRFARVTGPALQLEKTIASGEKASELVVTAVDGAGLLSQVFAGKSTNPKQDFQTGLYNIRRTFQTFATMKAEGGIPEQYVLQAAPVEKAGSLFLSFYDVLPSLVGFEKAKTYLLLFQNNMELRPGGGFIGSYAEITVEKGKLANIIIRDVYDADGQLKEHIEPPFQLRRYLGSQHWFLRDSNFDVDFTKNAATAAYFYDLEMGRKVDGVIAVDTTFLKNVLAAVGPLSVPGYNETVTVDNFFMLMESYAQNNFFPGSTQKKDFLLAVYNALLVRLSEKNIAAYIPLLSAVSTSVEQKHVLFTFPDASIQKVFSVNNMSSSLFDGRTEEAGVINDFLGVSEANIGQNKVNYYLDRVFTHTVSFAQPEVVAETLIIQYINKSKQGSQFGGDYKNYVRFILPAGAMLQKVAIDGVDRQIIDAITDVKVFSTPRFVPPNGFEVEKNVAEGKTVFGFLVTVPAATKKYVSISYTIPWKQTQRKELRYSLKLFKQPGTGADPYLLSLSFPQNFTLVDANSNFQQQNQYASHITDISQDRTIVVRFATP